MRIRPDAVVVTILTICVIVTIGYVVGLYVLGDCRLPFDCSARFRPEVCAADPEIPKKYCATHERLAD